MSWETFRSGDREEENLLISYMFIGYVIAICQKAGISCPQGAQSIGGSEHYAMHQVLLREVSMMY